MPRRADKQDACRPALVRLLQPAGSKHCGQYCVAMIAGVTVEAAFDAVGHRHGTHCYELHRALLKLGVPVLPAEEGRSFRVRGGESLPPRCLVRLRNPDDPVKNHWVVRWDGAFYDPAGELTAWTLCSYLTVWP